MATEDFASALRRFGGMYGAAYDNNGKLLTDTVQVTATTQRGRIEIPLVGTTRVGYKPGRTTAEGSISFQKVDSSWEMLVYNSLKGDVTAMRAARDAGDFAELSGVFNLKLVYDDPYSYGREVWQVKGCQIWQFDVGINTTEEFIQRELPMTFDEAIPLQTFSMNGQTRTTLVDVAEAPAP